MAHLLNNKISLERQSGFRNNRSTTTALLNMTDNLFCALDGSMLAMCMITLRLSTKLTTHSGLL